MLKSIGSLIDLRGGGKYCFNEVTLLAGILSYNWNHSGCLGRIWSGRTDTFMQTEDKGKSVWDVLTKACMILFLKDHFISTTKQLFGPSQACIQLTTAASNTNTTNKHFGWWRNPTFPLAYCVIWHSREPKNKRNKTNRGIPGLSAGNAMIWIKMVMVWSGVDGSIILLRSPDIQQGFDPAVGGRSSGGPAEV